MESAPAGQDPAPEAAQGDGKMSAEEIGVARIKGALARPLSQARRPDGDRGDTSRRWGLLDAARAEFSPPTVRPTGTAVHFR